MGLAPLNTPAQHTPKGRKRGGTKVPANLCTAGLPQSPSRIKALRGVLSVPGDGSPVAETSPNIFNMLLSRGSGLSNDLAAAVVEDIFPNEPDEMPVPPTPALYYNGGVLPQPLPDPLSKEEDFLKFVSELERLSMANSEAEDSSVQDKKAKTTGKRSRFGLSILMAVATVGLVGLVGMLTGRHDGDEDDN